MASSYDFFISGDHNAAKTLIGDALTAEGFTISMNTDGGFHAVRGSTAATVLWGGLAGKKLHMAFDTQFFVDDRGQLVARLVRDLAVSALKGGALGASKTATAFEATSHAVGTALTNAGVLVHSIAN
jgi:predicted dinucleotide-binding enzyme